MYIIKTAICGKPATYQALVGILSAKCSFNKFIEHLTVQGIVGTHHEGKKARPVTFQSTGYILSWNPYKSSASGRDYFPSFIDKQDQRSKIMDPQLVSSRAGVLRPVCLPRFAKAKNDGLWRH